MKANLKSVILIGGITMTSTLSSQAVVIVFTDANAQEATVSAGTLSPLTEPADSSALTTLSYSVTGLMIDADGVPDTVTFTIAVSPVGAGPINWDTNGDSPSEFDYQNGTFNNGEGISFGTIGVSGTSSSGQSYTLNSALYTEVDYRRFAGADASSIAGDVTTIAQNTLGAAVLNDTSFSTQQTVGTWNVQFVDFTVDVTVVPEPSSVTLIGLGGLALLMRRRK